VNDKLIHQFGESPRQDVLVLDTDSTTHSLESRKREKAVVGRNKKNRGKPCYQWSVGFVRGEVVDTRQHPFGKKRVKKKHIRYAIIENLAIELSAPALYKFYHGRQTIENFFKESKNPFNSGKMPSQKFRANEAYLQFVAIAYNCYHWFKKNFFHQPGKLTLWKPQELN